MKYRLTHELLNYLKQKGYTMLVGVGQDTLKDYILIPVEWNVEEYMENIHATNYHRHSVHMIDDLLKLDLRHSFMHRVIIPS
jgi:hypothetical protein